MIASIVTIEPISSTATADPADPLPRVADRQAKTIASTAKKKPSTACCDFENTSATPATR